MSKLRLALVIHVCVSLFACGKKDRKTDHGASLQGKWKETHSLFCGEHIVPSDPADTIEFHSNGTLSMIKNHSSTCRVVTTLNISYPNPTTFKIVTLKDVKFLDESGCATFGITSSRLEFEKTKDYSATPTPTYAIHGDQLNLSNNGTCPDGSPGTLQQTYIRQ